MTDHDEIRQQMLELIYGLLSDDEASQLASRIGRDPELARTYAEVKEQTDLLASAVLVAKEPLPDFAAWKKKAQTQQRVERSQAARRFVRGVQALTALAASVLILAGGAGFFFAATGELAQAPSASLSKVAAVNDTTLGKTALELEVSGPRVLSSEVTNRFDVSVRNQAARQDDAEISYNFTSPQGDTIVAGKQQAINGLAKIALPAEKAQSAKLQISAQQGAASISVESPQLNAEPPKTITTIALDRPLVRAGETIRWRSNTLSSQTQQAVDGAVEFQIVDPDQRPVSGFVSQGTTQRGVAASMWSLPTDVSAGNYALIAKNADGVADVTRFQVDPLAPPIWNARLDFARDWFRPGEEIAASLQLSSQSGQPLANQKLTMRQIVGGRFVSTPQEIQTSEDGAAEVKLQLAYNAQSHAANHLYFSNEDQSWAFASPIPLEPQTVDVLFCPEGGALVAGLSNRVYFHATDADGKPVELQGAIVNNRDEVVAKAKTEYRGRGRFDFIPLPQQHYRLKAKLGESRIDADLPPINETALANMTIPTPVVDADQPIEVEINSRDHRQRYGLAYYNNGDLVTQQFFAVPQRLKPARVRLEAPPEIAGAGEVTLYAADDSGQITPLAERMVFRRPVRRLNLKIASPQLKQGYAAGETAEIEVAVQDETGAPSQASLGVAIVNDAAFAHTTQVSPTLIAAQLLTKRLRRPEELKDPQTLLSDDPQAARELDFILATDGWREFVKAAPLGDWAGEPGRNRQAVPPAELSRMSSLAHDQATDVEAAAPPILVIKNQVAAASDDALTAASAAGSSRRDAMRYPQAIMPWLLTAALIAALGLTTLIWLGAAGSRWFWGPALAAAFIVTAGLGLSVLSLDLGRNGASDQLALRESVVTAPSDSVPKTTAPSSTAAPVANEILDAEVTNQAELSEEWQEPGAAIERAMPAQPFSAPDADVGNDLEGGFAPMPMAAQAESSPRLMMEGAAENFSADAMPSDGEIADKSRAKKEAKASPATPMRPMKTFSENAPAAEMQQADANYSRPQARYSLADGKRSLQLDQLQNRRNARLQSQDQDAVLRNQALGTAEYGLRQAATQQLAQQQLRDEQPPAMKAAGLGFGRRGGGSKQTAPAAQADAGRPPMQRMLLSRGAKEDRNAEKDAAATVEEFAPPSPGEFYYRAFAYQASDEKELAEHAESAPPETIYWAPLTQTDPDGRAKIRFTLPPTPGRYRITIDAFREGRLGSLRQSFATQSPP
ncbi:MAG: MG2 domain-containing protein [Blastopirellula sp. JB062]